MLCVFVVLSICKLIICSIALILNPHPKSGNTPASKATGDLYLSLYLVFKDNHSDNRNCLDGERDGKRGRAGAKETVWMWVCVRVCMCELSFVYC